MRHTQTLELGPGLLPGSVPRGTRASHLRHVVPSDPVHLTFTSLVLQLGLILFSRYPHYPDPENTVKYLRVLTTARSVFSRPPRWHRAARWEPLSETELGCESEGRHPPIGTSGRVDSDRDGWHRSEERCQPFRSRSRGSARTRVRWEPVASSAEVRRQLAEEVAAVAAP